MDLDSTAKISDVRSVAAFCPLTEDIGSWIDRLEGN
jgi:hypothetical protein